MPDWQNSIQTGDCFDVLAELPESSVHMCMTSPPYYGLRDYGVDGQIGLEETLDEYIDRLVRVGDDLRRVLRDDGSWWLNLGDTYAGTGTAQPEGSYKETVESPEPVGQSLGRKNKMLVPHRVAIALQESGWVVRNDVTWVKPAPMPSSVKDRLNTTTEQVFHLTPEPDYWYDLDAIREPYSESMERRKECQSKHGGHESDGWGGGRHHQSGGLLDDSQTYEDTMHPGDVFEVTTKPFPDAHFAVYPPELCEKPIKATCPPTVCSECGAPYERETRDEVPAPDHNPTRENAKRAHELAEKHGLTDEHKQAIRAVGIHDEEYGNAQSMRVTELERQRAKEAKEALGPYFREYTKTVPIAQSWIQTCDCDTDATESGICLDPFAGAGTTLLKAKELDRRFVGIELNPEYADMARVRVGLTPEDPARVRDDDQRGIEAFADGGGSDE
jgi:DNA modification methylase